MAPARITAPQCAVSGSDVDRYVLLDVLASRVLNIGLIGVSLQSRAIRGGVAQCSALLSVPPAGGWRVSLLCRARHCQGSWQLGGAYFFAPGGRRQCWSANPWWMRLDYGGVASAKTEGVVALEHVRVVQLQEPSEMPLPPHTHTLSLLRPLCPPLPYSSSAPLVLFRVLRCMTHNVNGLIHCVGQHRSRRRRSGQGPRPSAGASVREKERGSERELEVRERE
jgi:hypothetical protein